MNEVARDEIVAYDEKGNEVRWEELDLEKKPLILADKEKEAPLQLKSYTDIKKDLDLLVGQPETDYRQRQRVFAERKALIDDAKKAGLFISTKNDFLRTIEKHGENMFADIQKTIVSREEKIEAVKAELNGRGAWKEEYEGLLDEYLLGIQRNMERALLKLSGEEGKVRQLDKERSVYNWGESPIGETEMLIIAQKYLMNEDERLFIEERRRILEQTEAMQKADQEMLIGDQEQEVTIKRATAEQKLQDLQQRRAMEEAGAVLRGSVNRSELTALYEKMETLSLEDLSEVAWLDKMRDDLFQKLLTLNQAEAELSPDAENLQERLQILKLIIKYRTSKEDEKVVKRARKILTSFAQEYSAVNEVIQANSAWMGKMISLGKLSTEVTKDYNPFTLLYLVTLPNTHIPEWINSGVFGPLIKERGSGHFATGVDSEGLPKNLQEYSLGGERKTELEISMTEMFSRVCQLELRFLGQWSEIARKYYSKHESKLIDQYGHKMLDLKTANEWQNALEDFKKQDWSQWGEARTLNDEVLKSLGYGWNGQIPFEQLDSMFASASDFIKENPYFQKISKRIQEKRLSHTHSKEGETINERGFSLFDLLAIAKDDLNDDKPIHIGAIEGNTYQGKYARWLFGALAGNAYAEEITHKLLRSTGEFGAMNFLGVLTTWGLMPDNSWQLFGDTAHPMEFANRKRGKSPDMPIPVLGRFPRRPVVPFLDTIKPFKEEVVYYVNGKKHITQRSVSVREHITNGGSLLDLKPLYLAGNIVGNQEFGFAQAVEVLSSFSPEIKFSSADEKTLDKIISAIYFMNTAWKAGLSDEDITKGGKDRDYDAQSGAKYIIDVITKHREGKLSPKEVSAKLTNLNPYIAWLIGVIYPHVPSTVMGGDFGQDLLPLWATSSAGGIVDQTVRTVGDRDDAWTLAYETKTEAKGSGKAYKTNSIHTLFEILLKTKKMTRLELQAVAKFFNFDLKRKMVFVGGLWQESDNPQYSEAICREIGIIK